MANENVNTTNKLQPSHRQQRNRIVTNDTIDSAATAMRDAHHRAIAINRHADICAGVAGPSSMSSAASCYSLFRPADMALAGMRDRPRVTLPPIDLPLAICPQRYLPSNAATDMYIPETPVEADTAIPWPYDVMDEDVVTEEGDGRQSRLGHSHASSSARGRAEGA